jgi:predicted adenine nucleotide alpha hydrolase (AANH) superfamily ATPase
VKKLREMGHEIVGLWFNPNIHPYTEYKQRLDSLKKLQIEWNLDIIYRDYYGLEDFVRAVVYNEKNRCEFCYAWRLDVTARVAKEAGVDAFTTTLLVSPYQKFDMIIEKGSALSAIHDIEFLPIDFREGFRGAFEVSRALGLYRQKYCGCIFSEKERFLKKK